MTTYLGLAFEPSPSLPERSEFKATNNRVAAPEFRGWMSSPVSADQNQSPLYPEWKFGTKIDTLAIIIVAERAK